MTKALKLDRRGNLALSEADVTVEFALLGPPRTKKTSDRLDLRGDRPKKLPSKPHEKWFDNAMSQLPPITTRLLRQVQLPLQGRYWITAYFYLENAIEGDLLGYEQALADWLQMPTQARNGAGIITDDRFIDSWDGSRRLLDRANPRIEVTIRVLKEVAGG